MISVYPLGTYILSEEQSIAQSIPNRQKGEAEEYSEGAAQLGNEGHLWVDKLIHLHHGVVGHGPQGEGEVLGGEACRHLVSYKLVLLVETRLLATCQPKNTLHFIITQLLVESF